MSRAMNNLRLAIASRSGVAAIVQILLANILILGITFGTGIITARVLGPGGRGEQAAIVMWPQFLAYALTLGLPSALLYNLKRHPDAAPRLFSAALLLGTFMGGVAAVVGILFVPRWLTEYSPEVVWFAQLGMLVAPVALVGVMLEAVFQAREEFTLYNALRYVPPTLTLLALIFLALFDLLTPFSAALSYLLVGLPVSIWALVRSWRLYRPRWRGLRPAFRNLTSYGVRSYGIDLSTTLSRELDKVLVVGLLSPAAMGLYVVALSLSRMLEVFQAAIVTVLFSKASGLSSERAVEMTARAARVSAAVTLLAAAGLALFGPWALGLLYGQEYLGAVAVFNILVLEVVLSGTARVLAQVFRALDRPGLVAVLQAAGLGLSVPLLMVLVPLYGLTGAGLALLISAAVRLVLVMLSFPLVLKAPVPRPWLTRTDLAAIISGRRTTGE
jgi:O-antigen/teichoic acid export membrane protein